MVQIKITKGLDIPIAGQPSGNVHTFIPGGDAQPLPHPPLLALNLSQFDEVKFRLLVKPGDIVKIGQPLAEDKSCEGRMFVSPAGGVVKDIRRGHKRALLDIIIEVIKQEEHEQLPPFSPEKASRAEVTERIKAGGLFANIRSRPFNLLADPAKAPRSIFVKAIESAPFVPPAEMQVAGHEHAFQVGLNALAKLTDGPVHLVYRHDTTCRAFLDAHNVQKHTAEGPHPIGTHSVHIQKLDPIATTDNIVWTVDAHDVVSIGYLFLTGRYHVERVISIAGPGIIPDKIGYFKVRAGFPVNALIAGRIVRRPTRLISGDPLMGKKVEASDYLGYHHFVFCAIPENTQREFLHFMGLGINKYSFSRAYLSGHLKDRLYEFTTNQHGEHRPFIDSTLYDEVMPLKVPTMLLVKAVMAEDFELAETLGLLEVDCEDFALPTFVCPSKMEMVDIIRNGQRQHAKDILT